MVVVVCGGLCYTCGLCGMCGLWEPCVTCVEIRSGVGVCVCGFTRVLACIECVGCHVYAIRVVYVACVNCSIFVLYVYVKCFSYMLIE